MSERIMLIMVLDYQAVKAWEYANNAASTIEWFSQANMEGRFISGDYFKVVRTDSPEWRRRLLGLNVSCWVEYDNPGLTQEDRQFLQTLRR